LNLINLVNLQVGPGHIGVAEEHIIRLFDMANLSQQRNIRLRLQFFSDVQNLFRHPIFQKVTTLELGAGKNH